MARIRTIKPEFFTSEDVVSLSPLARLLYIALWCEADKEGRLTWKPKTFKMRWLPGDKCDIDSLCGELVKGGVVVLYGDGLAYIPGFAKHQHVNPRESASTLPAPDGVGDQMPRKVGKNTREAVLERDGYKCVRCGSEDGLQIDHILPQSCGGPHIAENLRSMCRSCNAARPVAGKALEDDLARDGYTVASLRAKFGIDASIQDLHAQGGRERKGKEGDNPPTPQGGRFDEFWNAWPKHPRKAGRPQCERKWRSWELDGEADQILTALEAQKASAAWAKDGGEFIPAPLVWLNQRRWEAPTEGEAAAEQAAAHWHECRSGIEAKGMELGIGRWDEQAFSLGRGEPWPAYQARVFRAAGFEPRRVA